MSYTHKKYPSIEQTYRKEEMEYWRASLPMLEYTHQWVVREKIHGSNFGVGTDDGKTLYFQSRNQLIKTPNINQQQATVRVQQLVLKLWKGLECKEQLTIFGEYFGGNWPNHPSVAERVQKGVFYTPFNAFAVFDIYKDGKFLPDCTVNAICQYENIFQPPLLGIYNTLDEAFAADNGKPSVVWKELQKDPLYKFDIAEGQEVDDTNIMEGIVIRPAVADIWCGDHRMIFKSKNDKFKENASAPRKEVGPVPEHIAKWVGIITSYVTENRVNNIISHYGKKMTFDDFGTIMKDVNTDVLEDFMRDHEQEYINEIPDEKDQKIIQKSIGKEAAKLVRVVLMA